MMDEDLQKALAEILNKTVRGVETGIGFLQRELPDVIQQLLLWHGVRSAVFFVLCLISVALCFWLFVKGLRWSNDNDWDAGPLPIASVIPGFGFLIGAMNNIDWLQILLAPKLYLIEYAASLAK